MSDMKKLPVILSPFVFLFVGFTSPVVAAPPAGLQSGEIILELEEKTENTYRMVQARTIKKIDGLEKKILSLASGSRSPIKNFDDWELNYLATVYLFCSMQTGVCPRILQTLFEVDLINSQLKKENSCPNLIRFWKKWISGDMDRRLEYKLEVGQFSKKLRFNKEARPKFIRCRKTIEVVRSRYPEGTDMFKKRYTESSPQIRAVQKTQALLHVVQKKISNVFHKTGVKG